MGGRVGFVSQSNSKGQGNRGMKMKPGDISEIGNRTFFTCFDARIMVDHVMV